MNNFQSELFQQIDQVLHETITTSQICMKNGRFLELNQVCTQDIAIIAQIAEMEDITGRELSVKLFLPKTTVNSAIDRLVKRGYIIRERNEADKRESFLSLSEKGIKLNKEHYEYEQYLYEFFLSGWEQEDQEQLLMLLKKRR